MAGRQTKTKQQGRKALGRGLSSLMRSTLVEVDVSKELEAKKQKPAKKAPEVKKEKPLVKAKQALEKKVIELDEQRSAVAPKEDLNETFEGGLKYLPLDKVQANAEQPRTHFKEEEIEALARSIKESGVLQPILVRQKDDGNFEIIAGERRFRAATKAGLANIPAVCKEITDREALELGIVENVQRQDLNPIEVSRAYSRLMLDFGLSQEEVAKTVGKERVSISNALRLLKLPAEIQELIIEEHISAGHGRALLMLDSHDKQRSLAKLIIKDKLSVRATEKLASGSFEGTKRSSKSSKESASKTSSVLALEERLRRVLGTKVSLQVNRTGKGELKVSFYSNEELQRLLDTLGV